MKRCVRGAVALLTGVIGLFICATPAHAALLMSYEEVGADVIGTLSGSLDLTGMTADGNTYSQVVLVVPNLGLFGTGQDGDQLIQFVGQITGPPSFGPGGVSFPSTSSGAAVFLSSGFSNLYVPSGYVSGSPLNATQTFTNRTFANMGLTPGDYVYTLNSGDTITVRVGPAAVPEPATILLLGTGVVGAGMRRWRQRRA